MPLFQQQQPVHVDLRLCHRRDQNGVFVIGAGDQEAILEQRAGLQAVIAMRKGNDGAIEFAMLDIIDAAGRQQFAQFHSEFPAALPQHGNEFRHQIGRNGRNDAKPKPSLQHAGCPCLARSCRASTDRRMARISGSKASPCRVKSAPFLLRSISLTSR